MHLQCGEDNKLLSIKEPSRCYYEAVMSTPAVCCLDMLENNCLKFNESNEEQEKQKSFSIDSYEDFNLFNKQHEEL